MIAALVVVTLLATVLSGITSTGGGFLVMGTYALLLPLDQAIALHAATFGVANLARVLLLRRHVRWEPIARYGLGLALGAAAGAALWSQVDLRGVPGLRAGLALLGLAAIWWPRRRHESRASSRHQNREPPISLP